MKSVFILSLLLSTLALFNATPLAKRSSDLAGALQQYGYLSAHNLASKEGFGSDDGNGDSGLSMLLSSGVLEGDEQALMAAMEGNEEQALAQFFFIRNLLNRLERTRVGRFVIAQIRQRYCKASGK
jgi:hypothetical protein